MGLPVTPDFRTTMSAFKKDAGISDNAAAYGAFYDKLAAAEGWKRGTLVYERAAKDEIGHFAVYNGSENGVHSFLRISVGNQVDVAVMENVRFGAGVNRADTAPILFQQVPKSYRSKSKLSPEQIGQRISAMTGKPLKYNYLSSNCETWARVMVGDAPRSKQVQSVSALSRLAVRGMLTATDLFNPNTSYSGTGYTAKQVAKQLDAQESKRLGTNLGAFSALLRRGRRGDRLDEADLGLISPEDLLPEDVSAVEAISRIKRYLMLLTAMIATERGNSLSE